MKSFNIAFQAFIPKSIGKPLLSYFQRDPRFAHLVNRDAFTRKLVEFDREGYNWIPEPGLGALGYYTTTDNVDLHDHTKYHSTKIGILATIQPGKVGNYRYADSLFKHTSHSDGTSCSEAKIHVGMSRRVRAFITTPVEGPAAGFYGSIDDNIRVRRASEHKLSHQIQNTILRTYISKPGTIIPNDSTIIKVAGSAGYPFMPDVLAPNIDFDLTIKLTKVVDDTIVEVTGYHNYFPAYELIVNQQLLYLYSPAAMGHIGPTPINLNDGKDFSASTLIRGAGTATVGRRY